MLKKEYKFNNRFLNFFYTFFCDILSATILTIYIYIYIKHIINFSHNSSVYLYSIINGLILIFSLFSVFWFIRNFFDTIIGLFFYKTINNKYKIIVKKHKNSNELCFAIAIPVYNDFCEESTLLTFSQTYPNCKYYILDDSTDQDVIKKINEFSKQHNVKVIRGHNKKVNGKKYNCGLAAAFTNFVQLTHDEWDFFVHVDSGDILNKNHVKYNLAIFLQDPEIGIITPISVPVLNNSLFQNIVSSYEEMTGINGLFQTQYCTRIMPGAGTTYRKTALESINFTWPDKLSEDGATSLELIKKGWKTTFTNIALSKQLDPYDYKTYVYRMYRWDKGLYEMFKDGYYNPKYYEKMDFNSKTNLFFTGMGSILRMPFIWCILLIFPCIAFFFNIELLSLPFLCFFAYWISFFLLTLYFSINALIRKHSFSKFKNYFLFALLFPFIFGGCFFVSTKCWLESFLNLKKNKFIVTKKTTSSSILKCLNECKWYLFFIVFTIAILLIIYFFCLSNDYKNSYGLF